MTVHLNGASKLYFTFIDSVMFAMPLAGFKILFTLLFKG